VGVFSTCILLTNGKLQSAAQKSICCWRKKWKSFSGKNVLDAEDLFQLEVKADGKRAI